MEGMYMCVYMYIGDMGIYNVQLHLYASCPFVWLACCAHTISIIYEYNNIYIYIYLYVYAHTSENI